MRARAKYAVIYRHGEKYPVCRMCKFFGVSRSGYYAYTHNLNRPNPNQPIIDQIARQQKRCKNTYGYRRMHLWLDKNGCHRNPKTVLRLMKTNGLLSEIRRRRQWKQLGQQVHRYENLLNRDFHTERPNSKWVTDISYIHTVERCVPVPVHDPGFIRQQHCGLQDCSPANGESGAGHHSPCHEERESRWGVAPPQRPGLSIYLTRIF